MFFPLPSPLRFFFGSFLAHLPFVFPLSSEPIFYNPKFYNDMARPGLKGTRRVPKDRAQTGRVGSPPSAMYARMPAPPAPPGYPGVPRGTRGLGNVRHMFKTSFLTCDLAFVYSNYSGILSGMRSDISCDILSGTYPDNVSDIWLGMTLFLPIQHISGHSFLAFSSNILSSILSDLLSGI